MTTDGEVDDQDSFIRMLLYANEFDIVGLIYSSSQWHYKGDGKGTKFTSKLPMTAERYGERKELRWPGTQWMQEHIERYAKVYDNLSRHAYGYPTPQYLNSVIRVGNIDFEGEMARDTDGSNLIKQVLLDVVADPVYVQIWGGTNTLARALKSIEDQYKGKDEWAEISKRVSDKLVIYAVLDQDDTYKKYIEPNWPGVRVLYNAAQFWNFAYPWPRVVPLPLQPFLRGAWFRENIKFDHGPLLSNYYLWGDGTRIHNDPEHDMGDTLVMKKYKMTPYDFISEGDSPAYFHLIDVGLGNLDDASYGGWGGRMVRSKTNPSRWEDGDNVTDFNPYTKRDDRAYPQTRWIEALQNDFAARADWCVVPFEQANHAPVVSVERSTSITATKGTTVLLQGSAKDPDGNELNYRWWQYFEVDSYPGKISLLNSGKSNSSFVMPDDIKSSETIHIILEVSDSGKPAMTRYQRIVVTAE